jgi:ppGpp synthetase/RelA/SpoT-type nucleotidyltranferase
MPTDDVLRAEFIARLGEYRALQAEVQSILEGLGVEGALISSRIKQFESVREKLIRTGSTDFDRVGDVVGVTLVVPDRDRLNEAILLVKDALGASTGFGSADAVHLTLHPRGTEASGVELQVLTQAANAASLVEHDLRYAWASHPGTTARLDAARERVGDLSQIVDEFELLLSHPDVHEKRDVHPYIAKHPFLLFPNPDALFSERPLGLGTQYRMDFVIRRPDASYLLVELENPRHRLFTIAGDFTAEVNHGLRQVEDWQSWIEEHLPTVQSEYPSMVSPEALVVIGRSKELSTDSKRRLERRNINMRGRIKLRTYDDLLQEARAYVRSIKQNLAG